VKPSARTLAWLTGWMLGGFAIAVAVLPFVRDSWPSWVLPAVLTVFATSVAGPVLLGGWMLGRALAPAGGVVGFVFALGLIAGPTGQATDVAWVMVAGYAGLALGAVGIVLLALRSRIAAAFRARRARRRARRSLTRPRSRSAAR
jgi:hypothetical protein